MPVDTDQSMPVVPTIAEAVEEPQDLEGAHIGDDQNEPDEAGASDAENGHDEAHDDQKDQRWKLPTIEAAHTAHSRIKAILRPQRDNGVGHKDPGLDLLLRSCLEAMQRFLWRYIDINSEFYNKWMAASLDTARSSEHGVWFARRLREWCSAFIEDGDNRPVNVYGTWNKSQLDDEDLEQEILTHLQGIGKYISAMDLARYMDQEDVQRRHKMKKGITERTARNWLSRIGFRFTVEPSGQYVDGHECSDVVDYRQNIFLPRWKKIEPRLRAWSLDGNESVFGEHPQPQWIVVWFHDESTFYAHDRRNKRWVHSTEKAVPRKKGEGASLMVADFVSADYGWLRSPDRTETARVIFKAGKTRDGYFTNDDILEQTARAMDIVEKHYPGDKHLFIFDNATTHSKRPATAPSASKMTKNPSKKFGAEVSVTINGKVQYATNGKPQKRTVQMGPGRLPSGEPHYFYEGEIFKGTTKLLLERGLTEEAKLKGSCKNFKCEKGATQCCQRRVLYNQPDFRDQESSLEIACKARGFEVIFLPKFHCELNFIEQCWGHAKRVYRQYPPSSKEDDLERNVLAALESVPVATMRQ